MVWSNIHVTLYPVVDTGCQDCIAGLNIYLSLRLRAQFQFYLGPTSYLYVGLRPR